MGPPLRDGRCRPRSVAGRRRYRQRTVNGPRAGLRSACAPASPGRARSPARPTAGRCPCRRASGPGPWSAGSALHPGAQSAGRSAAALWPDVPRRSARASLRTAVWALRQAWGDAADRVVIDPRARSRSAVRRRGAGSTRPTTTGRPTGRTASCCPGSTTSGPRRSARRTGAAASGARAERWPTGRRATGGRATAVAWAGGSAALAPAGRGGAPGPGRTGWSGPATGPERWSRARDFTERLRADLGVRPSPDDPRGARRGCARPPPEPPRPCDLRPGRPSCAG